MRQQQFPVSPWGKFHLTSNLELPCRKALLSSRSNLDCLGPWALRRPRELGSISLWGLAQISPSITQYKYRCTLFPHMAPRSSAPTSIPHSPSRASRTPLAPDQAEFKHGLTVQQSMPVMRVLVWGGAWRSTGGSVLYRVAAQGLTGTNRPDQNPDKINLSPLGSGLPRSATLANVT